LLLGTVPLLDYPSTKLWSFAIASTLKIASWLQEL